LKNRLLNFCGVVAESICCQMLWFHSLASVADAVRTNNGELTGHDLVDSLKTCGKGHQVKKTKNSSTRKKALPNTNQ